MTVIEANAPVESLTLRQRYAHYFVILYAVIAFIIGINLRDAVLYATVPYSNQQIGINAFYPQNWLLDTEGDYIFRARDMAKTGYKTTIQVDVLPVTANTSPRNILDSLILNRSQTLSQFDVLGRQPITLGDAGIVGTQMLYTFVSGGEDPFLETIPRVVEGVDVLVIDSGQAIIITFLSDAAEFDANYAIFEQFLNDFDF
jgi:hypothetical protein